MDLSIIIISWNTKDLLRQCLISVDAAARPFEYEVFVVDNASSDGSATMVRNEFSEIKLISNTSNLGFAAANNQALRLCTGEYALLLNPDTILSQKCLTQLITFAEQHVEAGAVGARLLKADGSPQGWDKRIPRRLCRKSSHEISSDTFKARKCKRSKKRWVKERSSTHSGIS